MSWKRCSGWVLATVFLGLSAVLATSPQLRIDMQVEREVLEENASGQRKVRLEPVESVETGDVLVYTLEIVNEGPEPAHKAKILDPILAYLEGCAELSRFRSATEASRDRRAGPLHSERLVVDV